MENINLVYRHFVDNYLDMDSGEAYYDYETLKGIDVLDDSQFENDFVLEEILDVKRTIIRDFKRILENVICLKKNNELLANEMEIVIDTYNNGIDYDMDSNVNFITLTEDYLYFNNIENAIDDSLLGSLDEDEAIIYETIIIVNRKYTEFYFMTKTTNILTAEESMTVKAFEIIEDTIKSKVFETKIDTEGKNYDQLEIGKILTKIRDLN